MYYWLQENVMKLNNVELESSIWIWFLKWEISKSLFYLSISGSYSSTLYIFIDEILVYNVWSEWEENNRQ